ncbi:hypothetical protein MKI77_004140 [Escherichia coli]|nr:hypothetical protein [Escherichia coli]
MEKLKQRKDNYEKQLIIFNDALEMYRNKKKITENLAATRKTIENRITARAAEWEKEIAEADGCLTVDADKNAFMIASAKEQLSKVIAMQQSAGLALIEASANLHMKAAAVRVARRKLCNQAVKSDIANLKKEVIDAVMLLASLNAAGERAEELHALKAEIGKALEEGEQKRDIAEAYISSAIANGNERLPMLPAPLPQIAYTISDKCPSPAQMHLARNSPDYCERLISGKEPLKGASYS